MLILCLSYLHCEYLFVDGNIEQDEENEGDDAVDNQVGVD